MARIRADRILETSTTTGTGDLTLAGAVTGFRTFSAVCASPSDTCYYHIEGVDASGVPTGEWETGLGTYSAANTLTRTAPAVGSAATPVSFSVGTKRVALGSTAEAEFPWEQGADVASAGTVSLGEGGYFFITGTTTITDIDFATDKAGRPAWVKFAGALTLTNGANLILPGGADILTAAGDTACFISEGSDVVRCVAYTPAATGALRRAGTAFPGSPTTGDIFWRSDRAIEYYYDGTRWLSANLFTLYLDTPQVLQPTTASNSRFGINPFWGDYDIYITTGKIISFSSTTTAANYFTYQFKSYDGATLANLGSTTNGQNDTQSAFSGHTVTINSVISSAIEAFEVTATETGASSTTITAIMMYRLVG